MAALAASKDYLLALVEKYFAGDINRWLTSYPDTLLKFNLVLWLKYGICLEAHQQNLLIVFSGNSLSFLLKDNDSGRINFDKLSPFLVKFGNKLHENQLRDDRIVVGERALSEMFITITLHLNVIPIIEVIADGNEKKKHDLIIQLKTLLLSKLKELDEQGINTISAKIYLLEQEFYPVKYMLRAGCLEDKSSLNISDINKCYGYTGKNFFRSLSWPS